MGRPRIKIDWDLVGRLASIHATQEEIAFAVQVSVDTLDKACKREFKLRFSEFCEQKKGLGKISLRRAMWEQALQGKDRVLMIWLSKQHLGFSDKMESVQNHNVTEKTYIAEWGSKAEPKDNVEKE